MSSASALNPSFWKDVMDMVMGDFDSLIDFLASQLMAEGHAVGDHEIEDDGDFLHFYVDLDQRGVLEHLAVVDPALSRKLAQRFQSIMGSHIESVAV